jgi:hypothetical protein
VADFDVPAHWKPKQNAVGAQVADCWTTPAGYVVALSHRPCMPVAVIRAGETIPFAYVQTLTEVPILIAADLYASMTPAFKVVFSTVQGHARGLQSRTAGQSGVGMMPLDCECHRCIKEKNLGLQGPFGFMPLSSSKMILCPRCGNKRCPKASDHELACTTSNSPGQPGSVY